MQKPKQISEIKVLIVEDDPILSSIAEERFKNDGYQAKVVGDASQALVSVGVEIPEVILLDIIMPGMNGIDLLKILKGNEQYRDTIVIMFSNLGQQKEIEESKKLGAEDFLLKAKYTPKEVVAKVTNILREKGKLA